MIDLKKQYRTKDGRPVRLLCNDRRSTQCIVGLVDEGDYELLLSWDKDGESAGGSSLSDLVEVSPYEDFKIDDKVLVKSHHAYEWKKRYFAGVDEDTGQPLTFADGLTSWITNEVISWDECVKAPEEST